ncbi:MAG: hypothetical protein AAFP84_14830 [Actinomycetota bacterium]
MAAVVERVAPWVDWIIAVAVAVVVVNLNVTAVGDPLSGVGLSAGPTSPGITEGARATFYAVMGIGGMLFVAVGMALAFTTPAARSVSRLLMTTFSLLALAGVLGLLLDYRDGPVRLTQLFAYVALALGTVRLARIVVITSRVL